MTQPLRCLDCGKYGDDVQMVTTSDRPDGKMFPRCEHCHRLREAKATHNLELMSPVAPEWFDAGFAGERWDEDDW